MLLSRRAHALVSRCAALPRGRSLLSCASSGRLYSVSGGLKPPQSRSAMGSAPDASVLSKVTILENLPLELKGDVVRGFGRGSKELGIPTGMAASMVALILADPSHTPSVSITHTTSRAWPTANLPESEVDKLPANLPAGIYFGWATLHGKPPVYPMVMSIGWNPYYKNEKKTAVWIGCITAVYYDTRVNVPSGKHRGESSAPGWPFLGRLLSAHAMVERMGILSRRDTEYTIADGRPCRPVTAQEVHIIEQFAEDFYGDELRVVVSGFIRPEKDFPSLGMEEMPACCWLAPACVLL